MTHNSLVASQRPHISLIDRRHIDHAALPIRTFNAWTRGAYVNAGAVARPLTALSHINVVLCGGPLRQALQDTDGSRPVRSSYKLGRSRLLVRERISISAKPPGRKNAAGAASNPAGTPEPAFNNTEAMNATIAITSDAIGISIR